MKTKTKYIAIAVLVLLFLPLHLASASIDIHDVGHNNAALWDDIEGMCGYVDYQTNSLSQRQKETTP
jgi:hypothetical protein